MFTLANSGMAYKQEQAEINASCHLLVGQMAPIVPVHPSP